MLYGRRERTIARVGKFCQGGGEGPVSIGRGPMVAPCTTQATRSFGWRRCTT
jgi:hypothetical protein